MNVGGNGQENFTITIDDSQARSQAQQTARSFADIGMEAENAGKRMDRAVEMLGRQAAAQSKYIEELNRQYAEQKEKIAGLDRQILEHRELQELNRKEVEELSKAYQSAKENQGSYAQSTKNLKSQLENAKEGLRAENDAIKDLNLEKQKATQAAQQLQRESRSESDALRQTTQQLKDVKSTSENIPGVNRQIADTMETIGKLSAGYLSVKAAKDFLDKSAQIRGELELMQTQFEGLFGEQQGGELFAGLKGLAMDSGLYSTAGLSEAAETLNIYGEETADILPLMQQFGDVAMGNEQKLNSLATALGKVEMEGHLTSLSMRTMLRAGFNPLDEIARTTGQSIDTLRQKMKNGEITTEQVKQAFKSATSEGGKFYNMTGKLSGGIKAEQQKLQLMIKSVYASWGKEHESLILGSIKLKQYVVQNIGTIAKALSVIISTYGTYKAAVITLAAAEKAQAAGYVAKIRLLRMMAAAQSALNTVMMMNPYVLVAAALGGLTAAVIAYSHKSTVAADATNSWDAEERKIAKSHEERKNKVNELIGKIQDETSSEYDRQTALGHLQKILPGVFRKYERWIDLQGDIANATAAANEQLQIQNALQGSTARGNREKNKRKDLQDFIDYGGLFGDKEKQAKVKAKLIRDYPEMFGINPKALKGKSYGAKMTNEMISAIRFKGQGTFQSQEGAAKALIAASKQNTQKQQKSTQDKLAKIWDANLGKFSLQQIEAREKFYKNALSKFDRGNRPGTRTVTRRTADGTVTSEEVVKAKNPRQYVSFKDPQTGETILLTRQEVNRRITSLRRQHNVVINNRGRDYLGEANRDLAKAQAEERRIVKSRKKYSTAEAYEAALDKAKQDVKAKQEVVDRRSKDSSLSKQDKSAASAAAKAKKDAESAAKKKQKKAEQAAKEAQRESEQAAQLREKRHELQDKWDKEDAETHLKAIQARSEADLEKENNAHEKELKQLGDNHAKELQQIKRQEEDYKKSNFQRAKERWDLSNRDKTRTFYDTRDGQSGWQSQKLTDDQSKAIQASIEKENRTYEKAVGDSERKILGSRLSALNDYLQQYGTFQQQKLSVATKYAQQIAEVEASGDDAETKRWKIAKLRKDEEKEKSDVDANAILAKIDWYTVFGNIGGIMKNALEPLLKNLDDFTGTKQFRQLGADQQKTILDAMENIRGQVGTNSDISWKNLAEDLTVYQQSVKLADEAEKEHQSKIEEYGKEIEELTKKLKDSQKSGDAAGVDSANRQLADINARLFESGEKVAEANQKVTQSSGKLARTTKSVIKPVNDIHVFLQTVGLSELQTLWDSFNSIKGAADGLKALNKAAKASKELGDSATQAAEGTRTLGDAVADAGQQTADALTDASKNITDATDRIGSASDKIAEAAGKTGEAVGKAGEAAGQIASVVGDSLAKGLSKAGLIGQIIAAILKILDVLKNGIGPIVSSLIDSILGAVSGIINNILSGKFVTQIIGSLVKGIGNILNAVIGNLVHILSFGSVGRNAGDWFTHSNADEINRRVKALEESNERLKSSIDKLKNTLENKNGVSAVKTYEEARDKMQKVITQTMDIVRNKMSYHSAHRSNASRWDMGEDRYSQINELLNRNRGNYNELATMYDVHSLEDIYRLTPEQMDDIRKNLFDVWDEITHNGKYDWTKQWDDYADLSGKYDDLKQTFREKLTGITFDSMRSNFVENLMDMSRKASDWTKDLNKMFAKSLLNFAIGTQMDERLKRWWANWADVIKKQNGDLTQSQIDGMKKEYESFITEGQNIRNRVFKVTGADKDAYSQDSSKSVLQGVTQDQVQEINGRLTSIQMNVEKNQQNTSDIKAMMDDFADLQVKSIEHLEKIVKYTSELPEMNRKLEKIRQNTEHL